MPALKGPLPSVITRQQSDTENELFLLRSIEWTVFLDTTYDTALEQANVILRYFLGAFFLSSELYSIDYLFEKSSLGKGTFSAKVTRDGSLRFGSDE